MTLVARSTPIEQDPFTVCDGRGFHLYRLSSDGQSVEGLCVDCGLPYTPSRKVTLDKISAVLEAIRRAENRLKGRERESYGG